MTQYPAQSHYPDTELTNYWPSLLIASIRHCQDIAEEDSALKAPPAHVCMGSLNRCIVACAHLGNDTVRRTETLLLTNGPVRYEAVLHSCGTSPVGMEVGTDF